MTDKPLIQLDPGGSAPVLSYNVPEPAVYFGTNFIELDYEAGVFTRKARQRPPKDVRPPIYEILPIFRDEEELVSEIQHGLTANFADPRLFPNAKVHSGTLRVSEEATAEEGARAEADAPRRRMSAQAEATEERSVRVRDHRDRDGESRSEATAERGTRTRDHRDRDDSDQAEAADDAAGQQSQDSRPRHEVRARRGRTEGISRDPDTIDAGEVADMMQHANRRLNIYRSMSGRLRYNYLREPEEPKPSIVLVETYQMASYLGSYGAGRTLKTFSLLPGERTTISLRTFMQSETERKQASSILDSFSEESSEDFEETVAAEQSDRETYEKSFQYHAEAEAQASWGWGSASVKGGVKGSSNSARENFAKNTSSATAKHAQTASAKREVEVNTSYESRQTTEREKSTEREIENVNLSRTLNFVFRQLNQEHITILSLVDVRVAFFNGFPETRKEVSLAELDALLEEHVAERHRDQVRRDIRDALGNILDYRGNRRDDFIEERAVDDDRYLRVRTEATSTYEDPATGTGIEVPGIILSASKNVLRTEGVMVEALLGAGDALDGYAQRRQELEVARREAEVAAAQAKAEREALQNDLVRDNDGTRAALLSELTRASTRRGEGGQPSGSESESG